MNKYVATVSKEHAFPTTLFKSLPDITDQENIFFTQIINQSTKTKTKNPDAAIQSAKESLKDSFFITESCKALKGFLTHNPKIYDAKVKARVFAHIPLFIPDSPYLYSNSIEYHHYYDWAGNAKYISKRFFLCTEFLHKGNHTTLYHEFLKETSDLVNVLIKMGLGEKHIGIIKTACHQHYKNAFPSHVPPYQTQVLVPYIDNGYISVSPVSSSMVQAAIHQFCWSSEIHSIGYATHNPLRPENVGALAITTGGSIRVLSPVPRLQRSARLTVPKIIGLLQIQDDLFVTTGLDFSAFLKIKKKADFATNRYTVAPKSTQKAKIISLIQQNIVLLFSQLDTLRSAYHIGEINDKSIKNLKVIQKSYVVEQKLSVDEMKKIWKYANETVQSYITTTSYKKLAYHPVLSRYISESIQNHLKPLYQGNIEAAKPELDIRKKGIQSEESEQLSSSIYLYIPQLTVFNAHADSSPYTTGIPAITALLGFADRLCRNIKSRFHVDFGSVKVAWLLHDFQLLRGIKKHEPYRWNNKVKAPMSDVVSRKFCNLSFDLILECNTLMEELASLCQLLPECLPTHFASGVVCTPEEYPSDDWKPEAFQLYASAYELHSRLQSDGQTRWLISDYSTSFKRSTSSILDDIAGCFHSYESNKSISNHLSLSGIGYKLLESPKERPGSRLELHAYCESVVGIQELHAMKAVLFDKFETLPIFWSYTQADDLILCKASALSSILERTS